MKTLILSLVALCLTATGLSQVGNIQEAYVPDQLARDIYRSQRRPATCWAACNSMLLAAEGINSTEEDQIKRMSQIMPDAGQGGAGAHFFTASKALGGIYGNRVVHVYFRDRRIENDPGMNEQAVSGIERGFPVMVATPQHGMVAVGIKFRRHHHYTEILAIEVLDPNPQSPPRRWLSQVELVNVFGFMAIQGVEFISN